LHRHSTIREACAAAIVSLFRHCTFASLTQDPVPKTGDSQHSSHRENRINQTAASAGAGVHLIILYLKVTMSFSSRRRNYLLSPHRRDALIEWYVAVDEIIQAGQH